MFFGFWCVAYSLGRDFRQIPGMRTASESVLSKRVTNTMSLMPKICYPLYLILLKKRYICTGSKAPPSCMSAHNHLPHDDQYLLEALVRHDQLVIAEIYREHAAAVRYLISSNGGTADDAADIFQDALTDLYRQAQRGYLLTCPFKAFFLTVCRNKWRDELRKRGRAEVTISEVGRFTEETTESDVQDFYRHEQRLGLLADTVEQLGPSCREIFKLTWQTDPETGKYRSLTDVAEQLQLSYAYLRKKKSECEQALRAKMKAASAFTQLKED